MTATKTVKVIEYSPTTVKRGKRALSCSPFRLGLFKAMVNTSIPLLEIAQDSGFKQGYTQKPITEANVEAQLMWLIKVGLLRREVDGQGITDSFRLTPLGKQIVGEWESQTGEIPSASVFDRLVNFCWRLVK